jgi:hypothetical protein
MTEQVAMRAEAVYSGVSFAVWKVHGAWFWSLVHPYGEGGTIGAAGTEAEAMREARVAIEQSSVRDSVE